MDLPCSGKSYLVKKLSDELKFTSISRDEIKELLFDEIGVGDANWSRKLGGASYALLFNILEKMMLTQKNIIVESNFNPNRHSEKLNYLISKYNYRTLEVFLEAPPKVLIDRFKERWILGNRHRGHADNERFDEFEIKMKNEIQEPFGFPGKLMKLNTSSFKDINY